MTINEIRDPSGQTQHMRRNFVEYLAILARWRTPVFLFTADRFCFGMCIFMGVCSERI